MWFENQNVAITTSSFYLMGDERSLDYNLTNSLTALVFETYGYKDIWIAETNPHRRKVLENSGAMRAYDPLHEAPGVRQIDIVVDAVGSGATRHAARRGDCTYRPAG